MNDTVDFQFFPTPAPLAYKMWKKFKKNEIERCLEPSCGNADLLMAYDNIPHERVPGEFRRSISGLMQSRADACEIDLSKHARLKELGVSIVGMDFLEFTNGAVYSHVIMNPPFAQGAKHVLHAWDILWDGEIVALLNAETIKNPFSAERQFLVRLIEQHGEVEFVQGAFTTPETQRKTEVECAIVYLRKQAEASELLAGLLDDLKTDQTQGEDLAGDYDAFHDLALPRSVVENQVLIFDMSVKAWRESIVTQARAMQHSHRIGLTMAQHENGEGTDALRTTVEYVRKALNEKYLELKDRAWTSILRGSEVTSKLSSKAQKKIESEFESIKKLEFTAKNIYGFLLGIAESANDIQMSMICDVFDNIVTYHSDNTVFYRGWKSNDAHRTMGMRVKARRFILPGFDVDWRANISWSDRRRLEDFDRVFAILDGKTRPDISLVDLFDKHMDKLKQAERVRASYFEIRFYKGVGTVHFFPRRPDLMDRLNRMVGQYRNWLPPQPMEEAKDFWKQYEMAEKLDKELREQIKETCRKHSAFGWNGPLGLIVRNECQGLGYRDDEAKRALAAVNEATVAVHLKHGIDVDRQLASVPAQLLLAA